MRQELPQQLGHVLPQPTPGKEEVVSEDERDQRQPSEDNNPIEGPPSKKQRTTNNISSLTVAELRKLCTTMKVPLSSKENKASIIVKIHKQESLKRRMREFVMSPARGKEPPNTPGKRKREEAETRENEDSQDQPRSIRKKHREKEEKPVELAKRDEPPGGTKEHPGTPSPDTTHLLDHDQIRPPTPPTSPESSKATKTTPNKVQNLIQFFSNTKTSLGASRTSNTTSNKQGTLVDSPLTKNTPISKVEDAGGGLKHPKSNQNTIGSPGTKELEGKATGNTRGESCTAARELEGSAKSLDQ